MLSFSGSLKVFVAVEACDEEFFGPLGRSRGTFTRGLATLERAGR